MVKAVTYGLLDYLLETTVIVQRTTFPTTVCCFKWLRALSCEQTPGVSLLVWQMMREASAAIQARRVSCCKATAVGVQKHLPTATRNALDYPLLYYIMFWMFTQTHRRPR